MHQTTNVLTGKSAITTAFMGTVSGAAFSNTGYMPWYKPDGCRLVDIYCMAGGAGGTGGSLSATGGGSGGGGGGSGSIAKVIIHAALLPNVLYVSRSCRRSNSRCVSAPSESKPFK